MTDTENLRRLAWDSYFAGVMSISLHPGAGKDKGFGIAAERSIADCAHIADLMLMERDKRFKEQS